MRHMKKRKKKPKQLQIIVEASVGSYGKSQCWTEKRTAVSNDESTNSMYIVADVYWSIFPLRGYHGVITCMTDDRSRANQRVEVILFHLPSLADISLYNMVGIEDTTMSTCIVTQYIAGNIYI